MANRRERRAADKLAQRGRTKGASPTGARSPSVSAPVAKALQLFQSGRIEEAERAYREILERAPRDAVALFHYGMLLGQTGRPDRAERCFTDAVALRPGEPAFHHGLGLLRAQQGRFAEALACHDKALSFDPSHIAALVGRAEALQDLGAFVAAEAAFRRAASLAPGAWEIRFGWATALADLGRLLEAAEIYRGLVALNPSSAEAQFNFGTVLRDLGRLDEAAARFDAALALNPELGRAPVDLVSALCALGRSREALDRAIGLMRRQPQSPHARLAFVAAVAGSGPLTYSPEIAGCLVRCFESEDVEHEDVAKAAAGQLLQKHRLDQPPQEAARDAVDAAIAANGAAGPLADPLLHLLLAKTVNCDLPLEAFLTAVRRRLCLADSVPAGLNTFLASLALQGFNNGYAWAAAGDEEARVEALRADLETELANVERPAPALEQKLLRFGLYAPLAGLAGAATLLKAQVEGWPAPIRPVLARCLAEPLEEATLAHDIPSLGAIVDPVSREVRNQYEENPYPRWFTLPQLAPVQLPIMLRRKFPHAEIPPFLAEPIEVLVAGCGTGRQPLGTALSFARTRVLAVDLSQASLAYAARMARRLGVSNVSFLQADLLALDRLGRQFPMIEAVGVLHHMEDPLAGWRLLCGLLRPGGYMRIGLYSALARADIAAVRERIAALGLTRSARDIRAFRQRALFGDEAKQFPRLALSKDIHDLNGCRDLLFHAKEHCYTLIELRQMMEALALEFVGFEFATDTIARRYRTENPSDPTMTDLARWAGFEAAHPDTFLGMYVFWCRKPGQ